MLCALESQGIIRMLQKMILNIHTKEATKTPNKFLNEGKSLY